MIIPPSSGPIARPMETVLLIKLWYLPVLLTGVMSEIQAGMPGTLIMSPSVNIMKSRMKPNKLWIKGKRINEKVNRISPT